MTRKSFLAAPSAGVIPQQQLWRKRPTFTEIKPEKLYTVYILNVTSKNQGSKP